MIHSLRLRLAIGALAAIFVSLAVIWFALSDIFFRYVGERYQTEMSVLTDSIAANVSFQNGKFVLGHQPSDPRFDVAAGGRYWQLSAPGQESLRSASLWDTAIDPDKLGEKDPLGFQSYESPDGSPMLVVATRLSLAETAGKGTLPFWIYCGFAKDELARSLDQFHNILTIMIWSIAVFLGAAALLQNFFGLRPLGKLQHEVAEIRAGNIHAIEEDGPRETLPLVREINMLLSERETAIGRARARASDLAHGLKTPLTVLVQLVQRLPAEDRETALKQIDLIRQRSDRQLQSARLGVEQMALTRVADIAGKLVQVLKPVTMARGLNWHILIEPDATVATDPADLAEAMGNLLENAAKWAKTHILVRADQEGDWTVIRIADDGPGAQEADFERILRRGGYLNSEDESTGLGLAISSDIAAAYGGSLSLARSEIGGLEVCLRLPATGGQKHSPA